MSILIKIFYPFKLLAKLSIKFIKWQIEEEGIFYIVLMQSIIITLFLCIVLGIPFLIYTCIIDPIYPDDEIKFKYNIASVYYHENNIYSVGILLDNVVTMRSVPNRPNINIICDVDKDGTLWYECDFKKKFSDVYGKGCTIHIHDVDDINTAGWNHGKFGSGTTTRIQ